jgi:hypothetical protein
MLEMGSPLAARCSPPWPLHISLPPSAAVASCPKHLASTPISRVLSTVESSLPPFHFSILITFAPAAAFRFLVPTRSTVHRQRSRTCATVSLTENGCSLQAATRPSAPQVRPHPCSLRDKTTLFTLGASANTGPSHPDELPALRSGTLWISRYRNIVDYPRKLSAGEWDSTAV